jgi:hypothetical protein
MAIFTATEKSYGFRDRFFTTGEEVHDVQPFELDKFDGLLLKCFQPTDEAAINMVREYRGEPAEMPVTSEQTEPEQPTETVANELTDQIDESLKEYVESVIEDQSNVPDETALDDATAATKRKVRGA